MQSINKRISKRERDHIARIKELPCAICDTPGPSDAHHIRQDDPYSVVPLCVDCHRSPVLGLHGQRRAWKVRKLDELDALTRTIQRLCEGD